MIVELQRQLIEYVSASGMQGNLMVKSATDEIFDSIHKEDSQHISRHILD